MENKAVGVICEYDPFHNGHQRQLHFIRCQKPDHAIVCVMSGPFVQRGEAALLPPNVRAAMALSAGADLVLELPTAFAVRDAEHFALGGVSVLSRLGMVDTLCFGCEAADIAPLEAAAHLAEREPERLSEAMRPLLAVGKSCSAAQGQALSQLTQSDPSVFSAPNNLLALCYLRAILRLDARLEPLPIHREGDYHAVDADVTQPSATALRTLLLRGESVAPYVPAATLPVLESAVREGLLCRPDALDQALLYRLRSLSREELSTLPDCTEGLHNRLYACCRTQTARLALLSALKTKRYAYSRLSRLLAHALLGVSADDLRHLPLPPYARLLGMTKRGAALLSQVDQSRLPLIAKPAQASAFPLCAAIDQRAYDLWSLGAGQPAGRWHTQQVVKME